MKSYKNKLVKGFTLIEMLVVIVIIGVLGSIAIQQYQKATEKARMVEAISIVRSLANAEERYYFIHDKYTTNYNDFDITIPQNLNSFELAIHNVNNSLIHIQARRKRPYDDGMWYIMYYFISNRLDCMAYNTDRKANDICKIVSNSEGKICPEGSPYICYPLLK